MQNRYFADVGDFGKYGMLRYINRSNLKLGINWYLVPDESHNNDGKHDSYLFQEHFKICDHELHSSLKILRDTRSVKCLQNAHLLAPDTVFYDTQLDYSLNDDYIARLATRSTWHMTALQTLQDCDIIFLDPDNGLQVDSVSLTSKKGNKYIAIDELADYYRLGKSIIFYNHRERKPEEEYLLKFKRLKENNVFRDVDIIGVKYCRGTIRDYIYLLNPAHSASIKEQLYNMLCSTWMYHFSLLPL